MTITVPVVLEPREVQRYIIHIFYLNRYRYLHYFDIRSLGPMTKEQYDKKQSTTRRVFDEDTGRYRYGSVVCSVASDQSVCSPHV